MQNAVQSSEAISDNESIRRIEEARRNALDTLINLTKCESVVLGRSDDRSEFATERIVKYDRSCTYADQSFWAWLNTRTFYLIHLMPQTREQAFGVYSELQMILKLVQNLMAADTEEVQYFLDLAVKELLEEVLKWNDPQSSVISYWAVEVDALVCRILANMAKSQDQRVLASLNASSYIHQRYVPYLSHQNSNIRSDALDLFKSLTRYSVGEEKDKVLEETDLIRVLLFVLMHE